MHTELRVTACPLGRGGCSARLQNENPSTCISPRPVPRITSVRPAPFSRFALNLRRWAHEAASLQRTQQKKKKSREESVRLTYRRPLRVRTPWAAMRPPSRPPPEASERQSRPLWNTIGGGAGTDLGDGSAGFVFMMPCQSRRTFVGEADT